MPNSYSILFLILTMLFIGSCSFTQKVKSGESAYELRQYSVAVNMLGKEYMSTNQSNTKAKTAFLLAQSYSKMGNQHEALQWYHKASKHGFGIQALEKEAETLKSLEKYHEAIQKYKELANSPAATKNYSREIAICGLASDWKLHESKSIYELESLAINSSQSDYSPVLVQNKQLFFSSDRGQVSESNAYKWTGRQYSDIYMYHLYKNELIKFDPIINSDHNEGTLSFNEGGDELYFTRCFTDVSYDEYCKLLKTQLINGEWTQPTVLPFVEEKVNYGHPFWYERDSLLFYSSDQSGGYGGFDIYFARLDTSGIWSKPQSIGPTLNTGLDEKFPVLKNDTLYFASDGHPGMGGLDIFYSYIDPNNNRWVVPFNMKAPINSGSDDFGITFAQNPRANEAFGYLSSARLGSDDIFSIIKKKKNPDIDVDDPLDSIQEDIQLYLAITVLTKDESGNVNPTSNANLFLNGQKIQDNLNNNGFVVREISSNNYDIEVMKSGYFTNSKSIVTSDADIPAGENSHTYNVTIILDPIIENKEIVLENIFYDFNESFIRDDAKPSLDELSILLTKNPDINIELSSHTDCIGNNDYNQALSQRRAEAAVAYILARGIQERRIVAKGYGELMPAIDCVCDQCTDEERQANRRTAFKVITSK